MAQQEQDTTQVAMLQQWQGLKTQAENGELRMDASIVDKLTARCDTFIDELEGMLNSSGNLAALTGFGTLRSAVALQAKFAAKAVQDSDSASNRLKTAIDIVILMRETFELSAGRVQETDSSTSNALGNAGV
ncbi:hypothetical protein [Nocardia jinanensis]|uniref:Uncharacterized protein n=1 Tax=Nocardia jinanensis TaxID=382504 RepID=A0A917VWH2_9NOCA|nr:hypothetical protein [Nocardia jinanensis]GGL32361.1 hypothetical protein GCM10011588_53970 [Nocardia jinanensis]